MKSVLKIAFLFLLLVLVYHTGREVVFSADHGDSRQTLIPVITHQFDVRQSASAGQNTDMLDSFRKMDMEIYRPVGNQDVSNQSLRIRKGDDLSVSFRNRMQQLANRDELLVQEQTKIFPSYLNHYVLPACQYYVFALRHILI